MTTAVVVFEGGAARSFLAVIVATVVLYFGKDILLPLAMAAILQWPSARCQPSGTVCWTVVSAALMVLVAVSAIGVTGYFLMVELTSVAVEVAGYSDRYRHQAVALEGSTPPWLQRIESGVKDVREQLQNNPSEPKGRIPRVMQAQPGRRLGEGCSPARFANTLRHWREPVDHRPVLFLLHGRTRLTRPFGKTRGPEPG